MEFNDNRPTDEAERQLAQSRHKTITPLRDNIEPEALPDSVITAGYINGGAIGNVPGDIEQDAPLIQPSTHSDTAAVATSSPTLGSRAFRTSLALAGGVFTVAMIGIVTMPIQ